MPTMSKTILIFVHFVAISLISNINGLTMKMIPIDSPELQIVSNGLTIHERHQFFANISLSRVLRYRNNNKGRLDLNALKSRAYLLKDSYYVTQLALGRGPAAYQTYVMLDTGYDETWVQCEGCNPCIQTRTGNFVYKNSRSFQRMTFDDPLCLPPKQDYSGSCGYTATYGPLDHSSGLLGRDTFYFRNTRTSNYEAYPNLAFGCGLANEFLFGDNAGPQNMITGIHGLGVGPRSFVRQLGPQIRGRFSYCLPSTSNGIVGQSTVNFGDDAQISGDATMQVKMITMYSKNIYHLYVKGISVDGNRLPINPVFFEIDEDTHYQGFFIDSGAPYTVLTRSVYKYLREAMITYFHNKYGWQPLRPFHGQAFDLCYSNYPTNEQRFPSVIFHFFHRDNPEDVDMILTQENMFIPLVTNNYRGFCMAVNPVENPGPCLFGAYQQKNFKFLYDFENWVLSFVPQICQESYS
ncbi:aspartic proteinase CDR1-like [Silene latifolia]|uniref:aspartic proteinase CDR1-like n=1 Tax=Silene latifolia TaxID=37657 RepID=UPI003D781AE1